MGAQDVLSRKSGVIVGDDVLRLFEYAREHKFAIPAIVRQNPVYRQRSTVTSGWQDELLHECNMRSN